MTIVSLIPNELKNLLHEIEGLGFSLCLIGGASRDFLMTQILSHDLDFEIRNHDTSALKVFLKSKNINFTELPYQIIRVDFHGFALEFSTPRVERPIAGNKKHHHFDAELNPRLSYKEAFKRRDFTLNAIGIELDIQKGTEVLIDPYGGVKDLQEKVLREISDEFFLDSVRFLRLIRFFIKYNFSMSESIASRIGEFDLSELSKHHFIEEMKKSNSPGLFINKFNELTSSYQLSLSQECKIWSEFVFSADVETKEDLLAAVFLQNKKNAKLVSSFFSMPLTKLRDLESFYDSFIIIKSASKEQFKALAETPIAQLSEPGLLKELKNLEEKKQWRKYFDEELLFGWSDWESVNILPDELEKTPVKMRSFLRFHKALQKSFKL